MATSETNRAVPKHSRETFPVKGMSCASCAISVESMLKSQEGVDEAAVNFASNSALVDYDPNVVSREDLRKAVQSIGYDLIVDEKPSATSLEETRTAELKAIRNKAYFAIALSIPVVILGMAVPGGESWKGWVMMALTAAIVFYAGGSFFGRAWKLLKHFSANMDTLVALSTGIAFFFSAFAVIDPGFFMSRGMMPQMYFESAAVIIAFILLGRFLEEKAKFRSGEAIRSLMSLAPRTVRIIRNGAESEIPTEEVVMGDLIRIRPGERIPVDGVVDEGETYIDESMLTGEPVPVAKIKGSSVAAGTLNQKGSATVKATAVGAGTLLAQIIRQVEEAQGSKAPVQKLTDKIASIFVPVVIVIALLSFAAWQISGADERLFHGITALVAVLIVACPCALGLATPTALMVGIGKGAESGILIRNAESLENAVKVNTIVLDKTGTITEGLPKVRHSEWAMQEDQSKSESILYELEKRSEHPLAEAITDFIQKPGQSTVIESFQSITGYGVSGVFEGTRYFAGNAALFSSGNIPVPENLKIKAAEWEAEALTVIYFGNQKGAFAALGIGDEVKKGSIDAVNEFHRLGIEVVMLTGDNEGSAAATAGKAGITQYKGNMLPSDKAAYIRQLQSEGKVVAMAGDGINDAEALATADVSIAMRKGADIAMEAAQLTIMNSDLRQIARAIGLSRATVRTIKENLFWAFFYNVICIPIAAGALYPIWHFQLDPMIAGGAMAFSSVTVVLNSLRLKRFR